MRTLTELILRHLLLHTDVYHVPYEGGTVHARVRVPQRNHRTKDYIEFVRDMRKLGYDGDEPDPGEYVVALDDQGPVWYQRWPSAEQADAAYDDIVAALDDME